VRTIFVADCETGAGNSGALMPRGAKKDVPVTKLLWENGLFLDKDSFLGWRSDSTPHLFLKREDIALQRERVYQNDAGWCQLSLSPECHNNRGFSIPRDEFELDHIKGGLVERCDCEHNLQVACAPCHRMKHVRVKWGPSKQQAEKEFSELYKETT
jgi:hypothetical protein